MNQNQLKILSSLAQAKYRHEHGLFLAEGIHIVEELLRSDWEVRSLILTHQAVDSGDFSAVLQKASKIQVETVTQKEFSRLSSTETPQGILAVVKLPENDIGLLSKKKMILVADGVSDPGNVGTMIRTAAAFGFDGFITTPGSADIFNSKTVRATQGMLFHLSVANHVEPGEIAGTFKPSHKIYSLAAQGKTELHDLRPAPQSLLVVGAEIEGVSKELIAISDYILRIPMRGPVDSLNAAVAAAIAMYEFTH